jgi:hypothetical protein
MGLNYFLSCFYAIKMYIFEENLAKLNILGYIKVRRIMLLLIFLLTHLFLCAQYHIYITDFESIINDPTKAYYNQYTIQNYSWHPCILDLRKNNESKDVNAQQFGINTYLLARIFNLSINLNPTYKIKDFEVGLNIPYCFTVPRVINKFGDILLYTSYIINREKFNNKTTLSLNIPTGRYYELEYQNYLNSCGTFDILLNNQFRIHKNNYGFYGNMFYRHSFNAKKQTSDWYNNSSNNIIEYDFKNGNVVGTNLGVWISVFRNLDLHFGGGFIYNHDNVYIRSLMDNSYQILEMPVKYYGRQSYFYSDLRLGVSTRIKSVSISIFAYNPIYIQRNWYDMYMDTEFDLSIVVKWSIF